MIYIDGNLPRSVADELRKIGKDAVAKIEIFEPNTKDPVWLRKVGDEGWLGITRDAHVRSRPGEVRAIVEHKVGYFILTYKNDITKPEIIRIVLDNIGEMEKSLGQPLSRFSIPSLKMASLDSTSRHSPAISSLLN